ncbi:unnamed protein product [Sphagnum jensenii]|uniref:Uncharacterized protein n=1 Tax=Sphagnum jensenii TaxID=128206 RepID=A0ABP0VLG1_9BRYO
MQLLSPITATIAPDPAATQAPSDPAISRNLQKALGRPPWRNCAKGVLEGSQASSNCSVHTAASLRKLWRSSESPRVRLRDT